MTAFARWLTTELGLRFAIGTGLAASIAVGAWANRMLSASGALGAVIVGALVFGGGGPIWALLLILFFATSSAASRWHADLKTGPTERFAKGSRRDLGQVLANGAVPAALAVLALRFPDAALFAAFAGALAAATADTWATEIGLLSDSPPALITTGEPVPRGTSGGVSIVGTLAAVAGAALIGLVAAVLFGTRELLDVGVFDARLIDWSALRLLPIVAASGLASTVIDSYLGATLQATYHAEDDPPATLTERPRAADGRPNAPVRGWRWLNNDAVNLIATSLGAALAWLLFAGLGVAF